MAQDAGPQGVAPQDSSRDGRDRRGALPFVALGILLLIILLILWMFWQRPKAPSNASSTQSDAIAVVIPPTPANPSVPAPADLTSETATGSVVPNVVGDPEASARRALEGAGFSVSSRRQFSASKPPGIVFAQTPVAGTTLDPGEVVAIAVAAGSSSAPQVTMPNIVGLSQSGAEAKVKAAGLVPHITYGYSVAKKGKVISQWPLAGVSTPEGSQGLIQVGITP